MYIEHVGEMKVTNFKTGEVAVIDFKAEGWYGKNKHYLEGYSYNSQELANESNKKPSHRIWGTWSGTIQWQPMLPDGKDVDHRVSEEILWTANPFPENFELQYFFTNFSLQLNNCPEELKEKLAPTDSRLRPD